MSFENLKTELSEGILTITINREKKLNALNHQTVKEIGQAMDDALANDAVKGIIVTGAGEKAFVAGADISEIANLNADNGSEFAANGQAIFAKLENSHKPTIAAVNGFALGGGCELAMACHMRVASENAKIGLPEVSLGIIPGYGGTQRMAQLVGRGKAIELIATADMISASEAKEIGLVNHVVAPDELIAKCEEILKKAFKKGPVAIGKAIQSVNAVYRDGDGYQAEANAFGECCQTEDFKEGTSAFLEKRKPVFKGK